MEDQGGPTPVIDVVDLHKWFPLRQGLLTTLLRKSEPPQLRAVSGVDFSIRAGEIVGLVGESGSGKTTVGMTVLRLYEPTGGRILFMGRDITHSGPRELRPFRRKAQIVFQNPYESLNVRFTVFNSVVEPLRLHKVGDRHEQRALVDRALARAELYPPVAYYRRYPHELSGGERQRVAIARAIVLEPAFLVADEPASMLDVSIRAGVLNLLRRLSKELDTAMLYISHDLATVRYICQRTATMYAGRIVEFADTETIIRRPRHPYTELLIRAVPRIRFNETRERVLLKGEVPNLVNPPAGCSFHPRCPRAGQLCEQQAPGLREIEPGHYVACHL